MWVWVWVCRMHVSSQQQQNVERCSLIIPLVLPAGPIGTIGTIGTCRLRPLQVDCFGSGSRHLQDKAESGCASFQSCVSLGVHVTLERRRARQIDLCMDVTDDTRWWAVRILSSMDDCKSRPTCRTRLPQASDSLSHKDPPPPLRRLPCYIIHLLALFKPGRNLGTCTTYTVPAIGVGSAGKVDPTGWSLTRLPGPPTWDCTCFLFHTYLTSVCHSTERNQRGAGNWQANGQQIYIYIYIFFVHVCFFFMKVYE